MKINKFIIQIFFIFAIFSAHICCVHANSTEQPKATFTLLSNAKDEQSFNAKIVLNNVDKLAPGSQWQLAFNSPRSIQSVTSVDAVKLKQLKQGGDFYIIEFTIPNHSNTQSITFDVLGKSVVKNITDSPQGYFLFSTAIKNDTHKPTTIMPVKFNTVLPAWTPEPGEDEVSRNIKKDKTSIEGNPIDTTLTPDTSLIVPIPVELKRNSGQFTLNADTQIYYENAESKKTAEFFADEVALPTGYHLRINEYRPNIPLQNAILLTHLGTERLNDATQEQKNEGYILEVNNSTIIVHAQTEAGFFYGLQTVKQLFPHQIFSHHFQSAAWAAPSVFIVDYPRFAYRGLHLDVARHFIPVQQVKRLIDLMAIHKLNSLQWHLTDDEGWRIEIKKYPELTAKGAWRGYNPDKYSEQDLLPAFGSSYKPYGGYYTQDEIREVVKYADERHITIVPEIDMPGHARALIMSLPDQLIDKGDFSQYTSIQGYHDNILNPCKQSTFTVIDNIITEVAALFPGKYIHIGGDEVPLGAWTKSCMAKKYDPSQLESFRDLVQNDFMFHVQQIINNKGKSMAGWEEVAGEKTTLAAPLRVYIWNSSKIKQAYEKSQHNGYEVIMAPAENLYFDLAYSKDPSEPGQYWAGYVDTFSPYVFTPISRGQSEVVIKGVQGHLWSEYIDSGERLDYLAFPKAAGLAELAWSQASRRNWGNFSARMTLQHIPRLQSYEVNYRKTEFGMPQ